MYLVKSTWTTTGMTDLKVTMVTVSNKLTSHTFENGLSAQLDASAQIGLEREDPAGLYTHSRSYNDGRYDLGNIDNDIYRFDGVRLSYAADSFALSVAAINPTDAIEETNSNPNVALNPATEDDLDYEISVTFNGLENLDLSIGLLQMNARQVIGGAVADDTTIMNITAGYTFNKVLLLGEYTKYDVDNDPDLSAYTILADYDFNDKFGIGVRYSQYETTNAGSPVVEDEMLTYDRS